MITDTSQAPKLPGEAKTALDELIELTGGDLLPIDHRDSVPWYKAPIPRRLHRCTVWSRGFDVERCACGAIRAAGWRRWMEKRGVIAGLLNIVGL